ncbi:MULTISPECIES: Shedu immune nuclease family protein [Planktothrix]|uniref:Shedu immune nuclease family protein n=1 Tax=Planktothrix TaxID=54304 RepID=UPI00040DA74A|nr:MULTISPECIES: Shedu immune nuclease family protein [Planktothrix]
MAKISEQSKKNTLLARLKLKLFEMITSKKNYLPEKHEVESFFFKQMRSNTYLSKILMFIFTLDSTKEVIYSDLEEPFIIEDLLRMLEDFPLEKTVFLEILKCPKNLPINFGVLINCEKLADSGYVYEIILLSEKEFPNFLPGIFEIRASTNHPHPMFNVVRSSEWEVYDSKNYQSLPILILITKILNYITKHLDYQFLDPKKLKLDFVAPPLDKKLIALLELADKEKLSCSLVEVPFSLIRPYDIDFCLSYPLELLKKKFNGEPTLSNSLLVYWDKNAFIMSDDYPKYLSYRSSNIQTVPCVVLGNYPVIVGKLIRTGGYELIPPADVIYLPKVDLSDPKVKERILDERLKIIHTKEKKSSKLYNLFYFLSKLIQNPSTPERDLHQFILNNPICLDTEHFNILSEVRLGKDYRADLLLEYKLSDKRIILVELEKASLPLFNKSGRLRYPVTHAIQQVEDWLRWWREHPDQIPQSLDHSAPLQGLVVIGRSFNMSDDEKRNLVHLNHNRSVKVITYDDLLDRIEALIQNLEN